MVNAKSLILGVDTSCDETSAAIIRDGSEVLSNIISSQIKIHRIHGGVVPEIASREHVKNLSIVVQQALEKAQIGFKDLTGIAVTTTPGLIGCLLVGLSYAKALAYSLKIPFTKVHHLKAHLFSPFIGQEIIYPFLGVVVSGGHTTLYYVEDFESIRTIGYTVDDAAGEAYDKMSKLLGLGYPGGPVIDKLAQAGDESAFSFTRARVKKNPYYLSFSGLKTAISRIVKDELKKRNVLEFKNHEKDNFVINLLASFQREVSQAIAEKVELCLANYKINFLAVSGGVAVNSKLRETMEALAVDKKIRLLIPSPLFCTDNGAMVAFIGSRQIELCQFGGFADNAFSNLPLF